MALILDAFRLQLSQIVCWLLVESPKILFYLTIPTIIFFIHVCITNYINDLNKKMQIYSNRSQKNLYAIYNLGSVRRDDPEVVGGMVDGEK